VRRRKLLKQVIKPRVLAWRLFISHLLSQTAAGQVVEMRYYFNADDTSQCRRTISYGRRSVDLTLALA